MALWVSASSSAARVKLSWRAAASKAISAAVLGILRRIMQRPHGISLLMVAKVISE